MRLGREGGYSEDSFCCVVGVFFLCVAFCHCFVKNSKKFLSCWSIINFKYFGKILNVMQQLRNKL